LILQIEATLEQRLWQRFVLAAKMLELQTDDEFGEKAFGPWSEKLVSQSSTSTGTASTGSATTTTSTPPSAQSTEVVVDENKFKEINNKLYRIDVITNHTKEQAKESLFFSKVADQFEKEAMGVPATNEDDVFGYMYKSDKARQKSEMLNQEAIKGLEEIDMLVNEVMNIQNDILPGAEGFSLPRMGVKTVTASTLATVTAWASEAVAANEEDWPQY
jgi:hypothetical protein